MADDIWMQTPAGQVNRTQFLVGSSVLETNALPTTAELSF
jgi:hypothetical protein